MLLCRRTGPSRSSRPRSLCRPARPKALPHDRQDEQWHGHSGRKDREQDAPGEGAARRRGDRQDAPQDRPGAEAADPVYESQRVCRRGRLATDTGGQPGRTGDREAADGELVQADPDQQESGDQRQLRPVHQHQRADRAEAEAQWNEEREETCIEDAGAGHEAARRPESVGEERRQEQRRTGAQEREQSAEERDDSLGEHAAFSGLRAPR